jgi:hypothetical protein
MVYLPTRFGYVSTTTTSVVFAALARKELLLFEGLKGARRSCGGLLVLPVSQYMLSPTHPLKPGLVLVSLVTLDAGGMLPDT